VPLPDAASGPHGGDTVVDHRTRPRRRGRTLDAAILEATIAEIDQVGYHALRVERVAERARASKASLYRRWPSRVELVMDAVYNLLPDPAAAADTGSLRGDLLALFRSAAGMLAGPAGTAIRGLISDALRDPQLAAQLRTYTQGRSAAAMRDVVRQATGRGELTDGRLTDRQVEAGLSLMRFHFLTHDGPVSDDVIIEIVDEIVLPLFRAVVEPV
jgi:AcrR family transcriptional regulator